MLLTTYLHTIAMHKAALCVLLEMLCCTWRPLSSTQPLQCCLICCAGVGSIYWTSLLPLHPQDGDAAASQLLRYHCQQCSAATASRTQHQASAAGKLQLKLKLVAGEVKSWRQPIASSGRAQQTLL